VHNFTENLYFCICDMLQKSSIYFYFCSAKNYQVLGHYHALIYKKDLYVYKRQPVRIILVVSAFPT